MAGAIVCAPGFQAGDGEAALSPQLHPSQAGPCGKHATHPNPARPRPGVSVSGGVVSSLLPCLLGALAKIKAGDNENLEALLQHRPQPSPQHTQVSQPLPCWH